MDLYNVTKVTDLKLQSPKKEKKKRKGNKQTNKKTEKKKRERAVFFLPTVIGSYSTEDNVCVMVVGYHQRGGGGGSLPVELSFKLRLSRATSKGMMSTQPMAPKSAKSRLSSSSEEELSSRISVDSRSSCTNRVRSARSLSSACRSASDIFGSVNRVSRNWELWEASGLLSVMAVFVAELGGGMLALMLLGLLR